MKIRIKGDTIRLRLSQTEVADIGALKSVVETTHFGNSSLQYRLSTDPISSVINADYVSDEIIIHVPEKVAKHWALSDDVGIKTEPNAIPSILIEKDFQCLTVRDGEDESDLFQNPNTTC